MSEQDLLDVVLYTLPQNIPSSALSLLIKLSGLSENELKQASKKSPCSISKRLNKERANKVIHALKKFDIELVALSVNTNHDSSNTSSHLPSIQDRASDLKEKAINVASKTKQELSEINIPSSKPSSKTWKYLALSTFTLLVCAQLYLICTLLYFATPSISQVLSSSHSVVGGASEPLNEVEFIQSSTFGNYTNNLIGPMFDGALEDAQWEYGYSSRGVRMVTVSGKISEDLSKEAALWLEQNKYLQPSISREIDVYFRDYWDIPNVDTAMKNLNANEKQQAKKTLSAYRERSDDLFSDIDEYANKLECDVSNKSNNPITDIDKRYKCEDKDSISLIKDKSKKIAREHLFWPSGMDVKFEFFITADSEQFGLNEPDKTWLFLPIEKIAEIIVAENVGEE